MPLPRPATLEQGALGGNKPFGVRTTQHWQPIAVLPKKDSEGRPDEAARTGNSRCVERVGAETGNGKEPRQATAEEAETTAHDRYLE